MNGCGDMSSRAPLESPEYDGLQITSPLALDHVDGAFASRFLAKPSRNLNIMTMQKELAEGDGYARPDQKPARHG